jgi:hypothetical protein
MNGVLGHALITQGLGALSCAFNIAPIKSFVKSLDEKDKISYNKCK